MSTLVVDYSVGYLVDQLLRTLARDLRERDDSIPAIASRATTRYVVVDRGRERRGDATARARA
jgi:hypothetical protein